MRLLLTFLLCGVALSSVAGCSTHALSPKGATVVATRNPVGGDCTSLKYIVGKGGGTFGGGLISNDDLIEYAMNDLRNKGAEVGATHIQHDAPQMGQGDGTTTTVTITGTAYRCPASTANAQR